MARPLLFLPRMRIATLIGLGLLLSGCFEGAASSDEWTAESTDDEGGDQYAPYGSTDRADGFDPPNGPLVFEQACEEGQQITIAAVGDILLHGRLQEQAFRESDRHHSLWSGVEDLLEMADITYANLEGPAAAGVDKGGLDRTDPGMVLDGRVYSSYPQFNYHPSLVQSLVESGIDVVSTANNHSLDRLSLGVDRTLDALDEAGLPYTGTRRRSSSDRWYTITEVQGIRLAWLACTYSTNYIEDQGWLRSERPFLRDQVLYCFDEEDEVVGHVRDLAARSDVDAVIVTPHWGDEYQANPNDEQVRLAHRLANAGATAIIGSHPHVTQPWERFVTDDGRETFVLYSLGNFVSGQSHLARRSTLLLYLGLTRTSDGRVHVNGARYVPLHMSRRSVGLTLEAVDRAGGLEDSRALTVTMFRGYNLLPPTAELSTNPQCDPSWEPPPSPHPHDGWIGGACEDDTVCGGASCLDDQPGGLCVELCERVCPDRSGRATTFCVDLGLDGMGACVARCSSDAECRQGYACEPVGRYGEPDTIRTACVPSP